MWRKVWENRWKCLWKFNVEMWKQVTLIYFYELIDMEDKLAKLNQVKLNNKVCWRCDLVLGVSFLNKKR